MRDDTASPVVVIDCSRNRIRIHRTALHLLGNPDYVALLVNPTNLTFAIRPQRKISNFPCRAVGTIIE